MKAISKMCATGYCNVEVVSINKDDAKNMLALNTKNRPILKSNVDILKRSMNDGMWMFNGDSIVFDNNGNLKSGQHRLTAFIESSLDEIVVLVVHIQRDDDILLTLNRGRSLSCSQYLNVKGYTNARNVAAIAKVMMAIEDGGNLMSAYSERRLDYQMESYIASHKDLIYSFMRKNQLKAAIVAVMAYACTINNSLFDKLQHAIDDVQNLNITKGTLAHSLYKINNAYFGKSCGALAVEMIEKTMYVIAQFCKSGVAPDRISKIEKDEFVSTIKAAQ